MIPPLFPVFDFDKTFSFPSVLELSDWLLCFQSFGFILSVAPELSDSVTALFRERHIDARVIGKVVEDTKITVKDGSETQTLFDFEKDKITGIVYRPERTGE